MRDPLIILAPPRSFTSVVCAMLGQHPEMYGLPEVNLFIAETMREREGRIARPKWSEHGLLRVVAQLYGGEQTIQTVVLARRWLEIRANSRCVSVFQELGEEVAPKVLIDKSPRTALHTEYLQRIRRAFPNTKFIHLLRHPRPQSESLWRLGGAFTADALDAFDYSTDPPTPDMQKVWYAFHMNIITFLDGLPEDQWMRIRGEDFLEDPDTYLREIAAWLGVSTDQEAIEAMKHPERSPYACFGPANALLGNDPSFLREPAFRPPSNKKKPELEGPLSWRDDGGEFSVEVRELAEEFGYS